MAKTLDRAMRSFYWPYMSKDIAKHCSQCTACQSRRSPVLRPQAPLIPISPERPFQIVAADITELPISTKGNRYVLVMMDLYTKFVNLYPLKDQTAVSVAGCIFDHYIPQHGVPEALHSDQGRQFESDLIRHLCNLLSIKKLRTSPYHAQCDGAVERFNRTLKDELSEHLSDSGMEWDEHLPQVALAYNTTTHTSTGLTPFFLAHGWEARIPLNTLLQDNNASGLATAGTPAAYANKLRKRLACAYCAATAFRDKAQDQQRLNYDRHLKYTPYNSGDMVLVDDPVHRQNKLYPRWVGPYKVLRPICPFGSSTPVDFEVRDASRPHAKAKIIHYNRMKPYITDPKNTHTLTSPSPPVQPNTLNTLSGLQCPLRMCFPGHVESLPV
uniref:Gypsy retrotransposon integrase-like protein 1 n=1 Tax=Paramormyrops kingsleyae TaxID=1676925 RepID=A0A3B3RKD3_9TELE